MSKQSKRLRRMVRAALFAAILCLLCPMVVPIGPVPISLGFFAVLLTAVLLGPLDGCMAILLYLALGAVGLPVFSGGNGGFGVFAGPTGGYLWSYPLMGILVGALAQYFLRKSRGKQMLVRMCGVFLTTLPGVFLGYICGTAQYVFVANTTVFGAIAVCVLPFIPVEICKCLAVAVISPRVYDAVIRAEC